MPEYLAKEEADSFFQDVKELFRDTDQKFKETKELLDNISRKIGELGNRLGEFVQEMVRPASGALVSGTRTRCSHGSSQCLCFARR